MILKLKILIFSIAFSLVMLATGLSGSWSMTKVALTIDHVAEVNLSNSNTGFHASVLCTGASDVVTPFGCRSR